MDNVWMYYSQIIFGHYIFSPNVTQVFYVYITQKSINWLHISETYFRQIVIIFLILKSHENINYILGVTLAGGWLYSILFWHITYHVE